MFKTYVSSFIRISITALVNTLANNQLILTRILPSFLPDIEACCTIRNLNRSQQERQTPPEEPLCVDCQCLFRNLGAEGFQLVEEDTRVEEDKQTTCSEKKDVPIVRRVQRSSGAVMTAL